MPTVNIQKGHLLILKDFSNILPHSYYQLSKLQKNILKLQLASLKNAKYTLITAMC